MSAILRFAVYAFGTPYLSMKVPLAGIGRDKNPPPSLPPHPQPNCRGSGRLDARVAGQLPTET
jgi:hypothetical protein